MMKGDIEAQEGNPDFIEERCWAIIKGMDQGAFSLAYVRDAVKALSVFVDGLKDTDRNG
jgi:hypothetical protein